MTHDDVALAKWTDYSSDCAVQPRMDPIANDDEILSGNHSSCSFSKLRPSLKQYYTSRESHIRAPDPDNSTQIKDKKNTAFECLKIRSPLLRECLAEALGTFVLIVFGNGVVAQTVVSHGTAGSMLSINLAWGLAVMLGIYASEGVSGAHINPAVSLSLAIWGRFEWQKLPYYVVSQLCGAFLAAAVVYCVYLRSIHEYTKETASIFSTFPQPQETQSKDATRLDKLHTSQSASSLLNLSQSSEC